jgi:hypothetical protein
MGAGETAAYIAMYEDVLVGAGLTAEELLAEYSVLIRVRPTRARTQ